MLQLRSGNVPDLVVFFDGVNDAWTAYEQGTAGGHQAQEQAAARVEGRSSEFVTPGIVEAWLESSNIPLLLDIAGSRDGTCEDYANYASMGVNCDSLADGVIRTYRGNCRVVEALGLYYGFECLFLWQPCIWWGDKPLSDEERPIMVGGEVHDFNTEDDAYMQLLASVIRAYSDSVAGTECCISYTDIFHETREQVYTDNTGCHLSPYGNRMVAAAILDDIQLLGQAPAGDAAGSGDGTD